jgi:hypothetical protein
VNFQRWGVHSEDINTKSLRSSSSITHPATVDPCAHEHEAILVGFGCQVHLQELQDMKPIYFTSICCI